MNHRWMVAGSAAVIVSLVALVAGCGRTDRATVAGTLIRNDGTPLVGARVIATSPATGKSAYGQTDANGKFKLGVSEAADGVPPGEYEVIVLESRGDSEARPAATIAEKYQNRATSGISLNVEDGDSTILDLKLDPP